MGWFLFDIFPILFFLVFALVIGTMLFTLFKGIQQERKNDASPRLTVEAAIIAKRTHVWGRRHSRTAYYATFQVTSGDRMELEIPYHQFGYLIEGDRGKLTFQGTRFLGFDRS